MKFKLPKWFIVFGLKVRAKIDARLPFNVAAQYEPLKALISINATHDSEHELMHSILHELGHALGFEHTSDGGIMDPNRNLFAQVCVEETCAQPNLSAE